MVSTWSQRGIVSWVTYKHRPDLEINVENEFESLFLDMSINNKHIIIGEIYRVPNTNEKFSINRYETILKKLHNIKAKVHLANDQNFDYLKVQNHKNTLDLFNHFLSSGFIPTTTVPSRITHTSTTLIDNCRHAYFVHLVHGFNQCVRLCRFR